MVRANLSGRSSRFGKSSGSRKRGGGLTKFWNDYSTWIVIFIFVAVVAVIAIVCSTSDSGFANITDMFKGTGGGQLKDLQITYFMSPGCPWCQKMTKLLTSEGELGSVTVVDVTKPEGQQLAKKMGAANRGLPAFVSRKNRTGAVGYKKSVAELMKSLSPGNKPAQPKKEAMTNDKNNPQRGSATEGGPQRGSVAEGDLVVFVSSGCSWCTKLKKDLQEAGMMDKCEVVDVSTPDGQKMANTLITNFRGVPCVYSRRTKKQSVGYKSVDQIIQALS